MSLSHASSNHSILTTKKIFEQLSVSTKSILEQARKNEFSTLEIELHQKFAEAERQCMAKLLEQYDWDTPSFYSAEKTYRKISRNKKSYMTLAGQVTLMRSLYRTIRNGSTYCPKIFEVKSCTVH